jgi:acid phosphatase
MMLPLLSSITEVLQQGPNRTYTAHTGSSFKPPPLVVAFTHDNQINQLAAATGVFDNQRNLTTDRIDESRVSPLLRDIGSVHLC